MCKIINNSSDFVVDCPVWLLIRRFIFAHLFYPDLRVLSSLRDLIAQSKLVAAHNPSHGSKRPVTDDIIHASHSLIKIMVPEALRN